MALPDFIGIGAQRAGSTWLHELLLGHAGIYMPTRRKEVHYFDQYFSRGRMWYEGFFEQAGPTQIAGEVTPDYLHTPGCAQRVAELLPNTKLIVILRDPVERAYSHYKKLVKDDNYRGSFEDALQERADLIERGFYAAQLRDYLKHFSKDRICVLIYEDAVNQVEWTKAVLAAFLELNPAGFTAGAGQGVVHQSYVPRARAAYALSKKLARQLHAADLDWLVNTAKQLRAERLFGQTASSLGLPPETRQELQAAYRADIAALEQLLGLTLRAWKQAG